MTLLFLKVRWNELINLQVLILILLNRLQVAHKCWLFVFDLVVDILIREIHLISYLVFILSFTENWTLVEDYNFWLSWNLLSLGHCKCCLMSWSLWRYILLILVHILGTGANVKVLFVIKIKIIEKTLKNGWTYLIRLASLIIVNLLEFLQELD